MSEIKRYLPMLILAHSETRLPTVSMEECDDGDYVLYSDYQSLKQQLTEAHSEFETKRKALTGGGLE